LKKQKNKNLNQGGYQGGSQDILGSVFDPHVNSHIVKAKEEKATIWACG
jgi:hypothetical protein